MQIVELDAAYLSNDPTLAAAVRLIPSLHGYALIDHGVTAAVALYEPGRIQHLEVMPDARRTGAARHLIKHLVALSEKTVAVIEPSNVAAVCLFVTSGFRIVGFNMGQGDNRYLLEYDAKWTPRFHDSLAAAKQRLVQIAPLIRVVETAPIVIPKVRRR